MKTRFAPLAAVALVSALAVSLMAPSSVGQAPLPPAAKWEYLTRNVNEADTFSGDGKEGWELVAVVRYSHNPAGVFAYFKRPLRDNAFVPAE